MYISTKIIISVYRFINAHMLYIYTTYNDQVLDAWNHIHFIHPTRGMHAACKY